jgi:predicted aspartyl protease
LKTEVDKKSIQWLADTGAVISVLDKEMFDELAATESRRRKPFVKMNNRFQKLRGVTGHQFDVKGTYCLPIVVQGQTFVHPICVVDKLPTKAILGVDFLNAVQANIDFETGKIRVKGHRNKLKASKTLTLPPHSKAVIPVNIIDPGKGQQLPHLGITEQLADSNNLSVSVIEGLHTALDGSLLLAVENTSNIESRIQRGELLATWERCTYAEIASIKPVLKQNLLVQTTQAKGHIAPLSVSKRKFIEQNVQISVHDEQREQVLNLLLKYHDVLSENPQDIGGTDIISHTIRLKTPQPVHCKQFRIPWSHQETINKHVDSLLDKGCIEPSRSPFNAPLFCVLKPHQGGLRVVQDFRALNAASYEDKYIIREVRDCTDQIGLRKSKIFSTLDLTSGFWQQNLDVNSREYTAFTVPGRGRFQWTRTPMGLHGAPSSFARLMDYVMSGLDGVITYIDDLLIHSTDFSMHLHDLELALRRLRTYGLKLNVLKCTFATDHVAYLGFTLTKEGVKPGEEKLTAVRNFPEPDTVTKIREFTGLANYFRHMIKDYALLSGHLTKLVSKEANWKGGPLPPEARKAFNQLKTALCTAPVLSYPRGDRPFSLLTDASTGDQTRPGGLGAVLMQKDDDGIDKVISYASRSLRKSEKNYSVFLLELAAAAWAIEHFRVYLIGRKFVLYTDHKPLEKLTLRHKATLNRLQDAMNEFNFIVKHKAGNENVIADALSRNPADVHQIDAENDTLPPCFSLQQLKTAQQSDPFVSKLIGVLQNKTQPLDKTIALHGQNCFIDENGVLCYILRKSHFKERNVFVAPNKYVALILAAAHATRFSGHGGIFKTLTRVQTQYWWPNMAADVELFVKQCTVCQKAKQPPRFVKDHAPLIPLPIPDKPNVRVHIDLFGELKTSNGKKFILVITDAFSKYTVLVAISDKSAETVAQAFSDKYLCVFGPPAYLCSDRGREFCNQVLDNICKRWKIRRLKTAALHAQTNSSAESFNRTMIKYLTRMLDDAKTLEWEELLPALTFCYNTQVHKATLTTPFFLTFLREPSVPYFDFDRKDYGMDYATETYNKLKYAFALAKENLELQSETMIKQSSSTAVPRSFALDDLVLVHFPRESFSGNTKFVSQWTGPWRIQKILGPVTYLVTPCDNVHKRPSVVHVDRIKKFYSNFSSEKERGSNGSNNVSQKVLSDDTPALSVNPGLKPSSPAHSEPQSDRTPPPSPVLTRAQARQASLTVPNLPWVAPKAIEYG